MKFLIDAQLPRSLGGCFVAAGHEALHTLDLPDGNRTSDDDIIRHADRMDAVIVTKDQDFVDALILRGQPRRLLLISTGNIRNRERNDLLAPLISDPAGAFEHAAFVELTSDAWAVHW